MTAIDWGIVALYVLSALGIGMLFTKKAGNSTADFFVAGRSLPWWIAGTSIVATTFSADTPLLVAGLARKTGIYANWFWWSGAIGCIASVFFFSKLWRRTEAVTDIEFIVKRYDKGHSAKFLRIFNVFYNGVLVNCVVMASVTLAMAKIIKVLLNLSDDTIFTMPVFGDINATGILLVILGAAAVFYTALSGLYGVVYTDLIQFALAMIGSIGLAIVVYVDASHGNGMMAKLTASPDFKESLLWFIPDLHHFSLTVFGFIVYITVSWWAAVPSGGYYVQRLLACKTEKDSMLAFLLFNILHFIVRSWPWVLVGTLSIIYFPSLADPESAFPEMINKFLPVGLKGAMVASLLAAFMSTLDTQLNWGTSYLINDLYEPYIAPAKSEKHYVLASRLSMLGLTIVALLVSTRLTSIIDAYKYLGLAWGGIGTVMIARWYWWRVNPWSEITAFAGSLVIGNLLAFYLPDVKEPEPIDYYTVRLLITIVSVTILWVIVTFLTGSKQPTEKHIEFYRKMRIPGPGWRKVAELAGVEPVKGELMTNTLAWIGCTVFILGLLISIGKFLFHEWTPAFIYLAVATAGGLLLRRQMKRMTFLV